MSDKEVTTTEQNEIVSGDKLKDFLDAMGIGKNLDDTQKGLFIEVAQAYHLNPFKKEIHAVSFYDSYAKKYVLSVMVGYETYLKRAERTGKLDGWRSWVTGEGREMVGHVKIFRKDWKEPFEHEVHFMEVAKFKDGSPMQFWKRSPMFQLKKVAISQGFRLCFPDEFGGMPYTPEELDDEQAGRVIDVTKQTDDDYPDVDLRQSWIDKIQDYSMKNKYLLTEKQIAFCENVEEEIKKKIGELEQIKFMQKAYDKMEKAVNKKIAEEMEPKDDENSK